MAETPRSQGRSHTKGAAFRAFLEWIQHEFGVQTTRDLHHHLPLDLQSMLDPGEPAFGVLASSCGASRCRAVITWDVT